MTLYNNARHLPRSHRVAARADAIATSRSILLDDASADETEAIARAYAARDPRVTLSPSRQPAGDDRDLARGRRDRGARVSVGRVLRVGERSRSLASALARAAARRARSAILTRCSRIRSRAASARPAPSSTRDRGCSTRPAARDLRARWRHMCHAAVGAGDMVYGLMRLEALTQGRHLPSRAAARSSAHRRADRCSAVSARCRRCCGSAASRTARASIGSATRWCWPATSRSGSTRRRGFSTRSCCGSSTRRPSTPPLPISRTAWTRDAAARISSPTAGSTSARPRRRTPSAAASTTSIWTKKITKHYWHHAVYNTLVGAPRRVGHARGDSARRGVYEVLMLTHRLGLRGRGKAPTR